MALERWTAHRLARRAAGRGPLARWALWRLVRAGDGGEFGQYTASMEMWDVWLRDPRPEFWAALSRWRRPKVGVDDGLTRVALGLSAETEDVVEAARRDGHPIAATARARILAGHQELVDATCEAALTDESLAAFCVEHHLAPEEPHRAAVFFLLTGQDEQYRLADPDHSLLALAYQGASEEERALVRAKAAGEPDLVRALADTVRRGRLARLGVREAEYLVDAYAGRRDWAGLWVLVRELPVLEAARAVHRFEGWRPDGPDGALFDALAAADPDELAASWAAVSRPATVTLPVPAVHDVSIAPDGQRIALTSSPGMDVFTLPGPQHQGRLPNLGRVLVLDDDVLVVSNRDKQPSPGLNQVAPGICTFRDGFAVSRTAAGFAALTTDRESLLRLHLLSGHGQDFAKYEQRDLDVLTELGLPAKLARQRWTMAVEPDSGLVAFSGDRLRLARLTATGLQPLGTAPYSPSHLRFSGPDRLVGFDGDKVLRVWRPDGEEPHLVAEREVAGASPVDLPAAGVIVMADMSHVEAGRRQLRYLDGETLADLPLRDRFNRQEDTYGLFRSPDGTWFAVCYWDAVVLVEAAFADLAHRPLATTTPADLHAVRARLSGKPDPVTRPFLELLRTCLVHRFGTDVALGPAAPIRARADDIALGGSA